MRNAASKRLLLFLDTAKCEKVPLEATTCLNFFKPDDKRNPMPKGIPISFQVGGVIDGS